MFRDEDLGFWAGSFMQLLAKMCLMPYSLLMQVIILDYDYMS